MRILVVNWQDAANPNAGGAEIHLHEVFGRIAAMGHEVTLLCSGFPGGEARAERDGMEIHRVGTRYTFSLHARKYFLRALGGGADAPPFDVIVEDLNKVPLFTPGWSRIPVVPLVHHLFGWTAFREANPLVAAATVLLERPIPGRFRGLRTIAVSESTREDLVDRGMDGDLIHVIPNGVALDDYTPGDPADRYPEPTLLYLGRLRRYKRVDLIIHAVAELRDRGLRCRLLIGGRGSYRPALERLVERLYLTDQVQFLGFVSHEKKLELMRRSWIHMLTSPKEGWGIANLEAAACGTPTVASDSPGLRDSVRHGYSGLLVPHGSVQALAEAVSGLVADPEERARLGEGARTFASRFSWDSSAEQVLEVLRAAAGQVAGHIGSS